MGHCARQILIVDDDESTRWMVGKALEKFRADLIFAESATEAKRSIERNSGLDLVVCDYNMGAENGIAVLCHLRMLKMRIPFLLFTAEERELISLMEFENASMIRKPELKALAAEVARLLRGKAGGISLRGAGQNGSLATVLRREPPSSKIT